MVGETIPLDCHAGVARAGSGITRRFPIGPVAGISPFNFPLNLAAHKVAPAIAAGCSIVLKPPSKDPLTMLTVAEIIEAAGPPEGAVSILPMTRELGDRMVADERFKLLTLHRQPVGRLADEGAGRQEEGRPRARRQRRRHRRRDRRPRLGRPAHASSARSPTPARSASASSGCSSTRTSGTRSWPSSSRARKALKVGDPLDAVDRRRADGRRRGRVADPALGRRGGRARRQGPRRRQGRRRLLPADDPDRRAGRPPRSARTRRSRRSSSPSRSATSTTRSAQVND